MSLHLAGPLLLVGAGKMGGAMLAGWLRQGLDPNSIVIKDPAPSPDVAAFMKSYGIVASTEGELPAPPAVVVLAVKPQLIDAVGCSLIL